VAGQLTGQSIVSTNRRANASTGDHGVDVVRDAGDTLGA
jgi:hypothetical protein